MGWKPPPELVHGIASRWTGSWNYHFFGGAHFTAAVRASPSRTVIFALWHHCLLGQLGAFKTNGHLRLAALASLSGDGAIIAQYLERIGVRAVRGSSSRGAAQGAKAVLEALRDGYHVAIAVDGPRGPTRQPKAGPLEIARLCGVPIVPVAARATGELRFRSWDRFLVPLPRAHVAFTFGEPLFYGPEAPDEAELELRRRVLAARIDELEAYTAGLVHQPRRHPLAKLVAWRLPG